MHKMVNNILKIIIVGVAVSHSVFSQTVTIANPDEVSDATAYVMPTPLPTTFNSLVAMNRTFNNLTDFGSRIQSISGYNVLVSNQPSNITPVKIYQQNGTLESLLNQAALKFNARWKWNPKDAAIIFTYNQSKVASTPTVTAVKNDSQSTRKNQLIVQIPQSWSLNTSDRKLRNALSKWCKQAGWQLVWNTKVDYDITTNWPEIPGSFESAVNKVLIATQGSDTPLYAVMYDSNKVLEIRSNDN